VGLFEQADGGTIFLDEIGDVSPAFQVKLLRVLQEGEIRPLGTNQSRRIDVRVVAATNRDLDQAMADGCFRPDLYYRLAGVTLQLPPLRERPMDIAPLCERLIENTAAAFGVAQPELTEDALAQLERYPWPGNVRELANEIQRLLVLGNGRSLLGVEVLSPRIKGATVAEAGGPPPCASSLAAPGDMTATSAALSLKESVEQLERQILCDTLERCGWNKSRAAQMLDLSRVGLNKKLERYRLKQTAG